VARAVRQAERIWLFARTLARRQGQGGRGPQTRKQVGQEFGRILAPLVPRSSGGPSTQAPVGRPTGHSGGQVANCERSEGRVDLLSGPLFMPGRRDASAAFSPEDCLPPLLLHKT